MIAANSAATFIAERTRKINFFSIYLLFVWSLLVLVICFYDICQHKRSVEEYVSIQANSLFAKDELYRHWNASHGGVYVPLSETVKPNPYLSDVPLRDVETESGLKLTLMNPAWMTRLVYERAQSKGLYSAHITSNNVIRPENAPYAWEQKALDSFEQGAGEYSAIYTEKGRDEFRYMKPLYIEEACLTCHAKQGYKIGDLRGGISIVSPLADFKQTASKMGLFHGGVLTVVWLLGVAGIFIGRGLLINDRIIRKNVAEWQATFNSITDLVSIHDADHTILQANTALGDFLGVEPHALIGKKCFEVIHLGNDLHPECPQHGMTSGTQASKIFFEKNYNLWLEIRIAPIVTPDKRNGTYIHVIRDVTEIYQAQEAIKESAEHYRDLFNKAPLAYQAIGPQGVLKDINEAWLELFGFSRDEVVGQKLADFAAPDYIGRMENIQPELYSVGDSFVTECCIVTKNGHEIVVEMFGKVTMNHEDKSLQIHCMMNNVSQARAEEALIAQYNEKLKKKVKEKSEELYIVHQKLSQKEKLAAIGKLARKVTHDIRNPLGAISNSIFFLELKHGEGTDKKIQKHIDMMKKGIDRVSTILTSLNELSFEEKKSVILEDINSLIGTVLSSTIVPENITVTTDLDHSIPPASFDASQLRFALDHIIANAIDAVKAEGLIEVQTCLENGQVCIVIKDNGVGIQSDKLDHIFDLLYSTKKKGIGFGLPVARSFIEGHNGTIEIQSDHGIGTVVSVSLPIVGVKEEL